MPLAKPAVPPQSGRPDTLGRYRIVRELGRGAQGRVYLAEDAQLDRQVAIKTVTAGLDDATNATLLAEARTISQLRHPNIVTLYDAFEDQGKHCVVLEFVPGETLESAIKKAGRLAPQHAVAIAIQLLAGLAFAHGRGIVHRDIKPANILLDAAGNARIMDFGLAAPAGQLGTASGTPRYMAPEIIENREIARNADVFSVGMTLYEMLTGRAAVEGRNVFEILHKIANQPFELPSVLNSVVDGGLDQIVMRSLSKDPQGRYADAAEMQHALEHYRNPASTSTAEPTETAPSGGAIEFLLTRMRHKASFPALSQTISAINRVTAGEGQSVQALTDVLLKDFSLTNKLLRLVNSSGYGQFGGTIRTLSRAVLILGFDRVRNLAVTLVLFEHLQNKGQAAKLRDDVIGALFTGILSRRVARFAGTRDAEEGFICGVFHNLGRMLAAYYLFDETVEIARQMAQSGSSEEQATKTVLGVSYEEIGIAVARSWNLPESIVRSMHRLCDDPSGKPASENERLQLTTALASALTGAAASGSPAECDRSITQLVGRFGAALPLDERTLATLTTDAMKELLNDAAALIGDSRKSRFCQNLMHTAGSAPSAPLADSDAIDQAIEQMTCITSHGADASDPADPAQVLAAGIQDITDTLVGDFNLSDLLRIILETMYRAMGFTRVMLLMRDARSPAMIPRLGYGADIERILRELRLPLTQSQDVFSVVLEKNVDVLVSDIDADNIRSRIPDWFRKSALGQTFVLLPVVIDKKPIGLFYGDKERCGELAIAAREMNLLKTLRNQAVLALKQRR